MIDSIKEFNSNLKFNVDRVSSNQDLLKSLLDVYDNEIEQALNDSGSSDENISSIELSDDNSVLSSINLSSLIRKAMFDNKQILVSLDNIREISHNKQNMLEDELKNSYQIELSKIDLNLEQISNSFIKLTTNFTNKVAEIKEKYMQISEKRFDDYQDDYYYRPILESYIGSSQRIKKYITDVSDIMRDNDNLLRELTKLETELSEIKSPDTNEKTEKVDTNDDSKQKMMDEPYYSDHDNNYDEFVMAQGEYGIDDLP